MKNKFWNFIHNKDDPEAPVTLVLNGEISDETWFGDEVTPQIFRSELDKCKGDITVQINSPGGDVFAAAQIYNMLMDYSYGVTVKIDSLAASAASVIAMAGEKVIMSPLSMLMIHNPMTVAIGDTAEMQKAITVLDEIKESIINAYELKTGLSRAKISHMMDGETWMSAHKAIELGFADVILYDDKDEDSIDIGNMMFSRQMITNSLISKIKPKEKAPDIEVDDSGIRETEVEITGTPINQLEKRLSLLAH